MKKAVTPYRKKRTLNADFIDSMTLVTAIPLCTHSNTLVDVVRSVQR